MNYVYSLDQKNKREQKTILKDISGTNWKSEYKQLNYLTNINFPVL